MTYDLSRVPDLELITRCETLKDDLLPKTDRAARPVTLSEIGFVVLEEYREAVRCEMLKRMRKS